MSVPWWLGRLAAFDCESTGVSVEKDRIVTASVVLVGASVPTETLSMVADPGVSVPDAAAEIHGYTTARVRAEGAPAGDVLAAVRGTLAAAVAAGYPVVCMRAPFDLTLLDRELRRHDLPPLVTPRVIDVSVLDKFLHRYRRGSRKLDALCEHYGAQLDDAHDAASDALAAARIAYRIGQCGEVVRRVRNAEDGRELARLKREWKACRGDLDLLHAAEVRWAREQALSLRDYFAAKGQVEDAASVRTDWPVVRLAEREAA